MAQLIGKGGTAVCRGRALGSIAEEALTAQMHLKDPM